jgi:hypothetical protein
LVRVSTVKVHKDGNRAFVSLRGFLLAGVSSSSAGGAAPGPAGFAAADTAARTLLAQPACTLLALAGTNPPVGSAHFPCFTFFFPAFAFALLHTSKLMVWQPAGNATGLSFASFFPNERPHHAQHFARNSAHGLQMKSVPSPRSMP